MPPVAAVFTAVSAYVSGVVASISASAIGQWAAANVFLANAIGSIALSVGISLVQSLFTNSRQTSSVEASKINIRVGEPPRWLCAGYMRQGGGILFAEFDGAGNLWYIVVHSDSILKGANFYFLDDIPVELDGSGYVTDNQFCLNDKKEPYPGTGTRVPYFQIRTTTYSETDPVPPAIAELSAACPQWTSDHKLVGTTYSVVKCSALGINDRYKIYRWRGPLGMGEPAISIVGDWSNAYDPRDGEQTGGVPATYQYSDGNPVLIWAWFRTHRYGRNKAFASINWTRVAEQASICDQLVTGIDGTIERYTCATAIPDNKERAVAEQEILMSMDAQLVFDDDGKCWPRVGHYTAPTLTLTRNRDIVAMESVEAQNGESETQGVIVRYIDPAANFATQPSAPWVNPLYYVEGQSNNFLTVDILTCQNHNQAMRLAKAIGMRSQSSHKLLPTVGLRGLKARQERIVNIVYDNTFAGDYEIVTPVEVDSYGIFCGFGLIPIDADRWTLLPGEENSQPATGGGGVVDLPDAPTITSVIVANGRIEAYFTAPGRSDVSYQFQYIRTLDIGTDIWSDMIVSMVDLFAYSGVINEADEYTVRGRGVLVSGQVSAWTADETIIATMSPPMADGATGGAGFAELSFRNPADIRFGFVRIARSTTDDYGTSANIGDVYGSPSGVQTYTDNDGGILAPGTYFYWFSAFDTTGTIFSAPAGSLTATVT